MKGTIICCLRDLVKEKYGQDKWENILVKAGYKNNVLFTPIMNIDDDKVVSLLNATCEELNITIQVAADAFGEYWMNNYAPKIYAVYFRKVGSAREFILRLNDMHKQITRNVPDARPPKFNYEEGDNYLIVEYVSHRNLMEVFIGLVKGIGKHFNENLQIEQISDNKIKIIFK